MDLFEKLKDSYKRYLEGMEERELAFYVETILKGKTHVIDLTVGETVHIMSVLKGSVLFTLQDLYKLFNQKKNR